MSKRHVKIRSSGISQAMAQSFEVAFAVLFVIIGAGLWLSRFEIRVTAMMSMPSWLSMTWAFALLFGGTMIIIGLLWHGVGYIGRGIERAGLHLVAGAWASYAVVLGVLAQVSATIPIAQAATITLACIARIAALRQVDRVVERVSRTAARDATEE